MPSYPDVLNDFETRAKAGDGQFAIAFAILTLAQSHERLRQDLCFGDGNAGENRVPGVLERIAMEHAAIAEALNEPS